MEKSKKNILYLHAGAEMYGADKILLEVVDGIDKDEFNPIVVLPTNGILVDKLKDKGIETHVVNYPILRRKYFNPIGIFNYLSSYKSACNEIVNKIIGDRNISLIHVNTSAVLEGVFLKKKLKTKLLWHVHEIITHPKAVNLFLAFIMGRYSDEIICVSGPVKQHLLNTHLINPNKLSVMHNGITPENATSEDVDKLNKEFNTNSKNIKIGMIGRINAWKGQEDFLKSIIPVLEKNKNVEAFIVGDVFKGEEWRKQDLERKVSKLINKNRIHITGYRTDTNAFYRYFDIFVLPSTNPDPLPTVVLESMSAGDPIIAYNHGGVTEMVKNNVNGYLVPVRDENALSKSIFDLVNNKPLRLKMGQASKKIFENNFELTVFNEKINKLYGDLIDA